MNRAIVLVVAALMMGISQMKAQTMIGKNNITLKSDLMTPEALWAMGRVSNPAASPDGKRIVYQVGYYSVKQNKGHQVLYIIDANGKNQKLLTTSDKSETDASWMENGKRIAFLTGGQLWSMNPDGTDRRQLTKSATEIEGY